MPTYNGKDRKDVMIRQIREAIAGENRKDIIERLWKGRQERVRRGLPPGGNVAYGYRRNGRGIAIDPAETGIVRLIFEFAEVGSTSSDIARLLNDKSLARRNRKPWTRRQVSAVLARRNLYVDGTLRYGEAVGRDPALPVIPSR